MYHKYFSKYLWCFFLYIFCSIKNIRYHCTVILKQTYNGKGKTKTFILENCVDIHTCCLAFDFHSKAIIQLADGVYELTVNEWASNHIIGIIGSFIAGVIVYFFLKKRESNK